MSSTERYQKEPPGGAEKDMASSIQEEEICELKDRIAELEERIHEQDCTNLRLRADFENYRRRLEKDKEDFMRWANRDVLLDILEVADNFERALPELRKNDPGCARGIEMIYSQLVKALEKHGISRIDAAGKKFDPNLHEALLQEESDGPEGIVLEELQKGYMLNGKVLRHSKAKVSRCRT